MCCDQTTDVHRGVESQITIHSFETNSYEANSFETNSFETNSFKTNTFRDSLHILFEKHTCPSFKQGISLG